MVRKERAHKWLANRNQTVHQIDDEVAGRVQYVEWARFDSTVVTSTAVPLDYSRSVPHEGVRQRAAFGSTRSPLEKTRSEESDDFVHGHRFWTAVKVP